jgi:hypothetical protein
LHAEAALFDTLTNSSLSVNLLVRNLGSMEYAISLCTDTIPAAFFPTLYVKRYRLPHRGSTDDLAGIFSDRVSTG